ncbi:MAG: nucleotidyltransferase family protein [Actinomycetota bacterium]
MKAFILAAGHGSRLRPLTDSTPKCLLPVAGVPLLQIWLEHCKRFDIMDVLVNAHAHAGQVQAFARQQTAGVNVCVAEEKELLGSAGTLAANREFVAGEKDFFVLYGDVLSGADLSQLLRFHRARNAAASLALYEVPDPRRCGIVELGHDGAVHSFVEKPSQPLSNLAFAGIMVAGQQIFELIPEERPADIGFHLLPKLVGHMAGMRIDGFLLDIGTMENYRAAQAEWAELKGTHAAGNHF